MSHYTKIKAMKNFDLIINTDTRRFVNPRYLNRLLPCSQIPTLYYMDSYEFNFKLLNSDLTPYKIPENADIKFAGDINRSRSDNLMVYASGDLISITDADNGELTIKLDCNASAFYEKAGCDMIISLQINDDTVLDDRVFAKRGAYNGEIKDIVVGEDYKSWDEIKAYIDSKSNYLILPVLLPKDSDTAHLELEWSRTPTFDDIVSIYTIDNTTDVYAFNGSIWEEFPSDGVTSDHTYVRVNKDGLFYRYRFVNNDKATLWNPPASVEIDLSKITYTDEEGASTTLGGWVKGDKASSVSFQEFAYKLLHPYEAPSISFSINPSKTVYQYGEELYAITLIVNVTKKSKPITAIGFSVNNVVKTLLTDNVSEGGKFTYTYIPDTPINSTTRFSVDVTDGVKTVNGSKLVSWVGKSYFGYIPYDASVGDYGENTPPPSADFIKEQEGLLLTSRSLTRQNISTYDSHIMYAYPASFGKLTSIRDALNLDYLEDSYYRYDMVIDEIDYYVYILKTAVSVDGFTQIYK